MSHSFGLDCDPISLSSGASPSSRRCRSSLSPAFGYEYVSYSEMPCCGVIGRKEERTRRSASRRMIFGAFGSSSRISDIVSSSLVGTAVLNTNSTMRSESGFVKLTNSADVRCLRSTIRKSPAGASTGGRVSDGYIAGFCGSAAIFNAGSFTDRV